MRGSTLCTRCGERLTGDAVSELCPDCLTRLALAIFAPEPTSANERQQVLFQHESVNGVPRAIKYLGAYELQRRIGQGGVADVYLARQVNLGRHVAVKVLRDDHANMEAVRERFRREAGLAARLGPHPNIVQVYEPGEHHGHCFFSMEFVDGKSLAERLRDGPIQAKVAAQYIADVARAVHVAHFKGIIHRDIKPANILIDEHDTPRITDFGMAKDLASLAGLTRSGEIVGTV